MTQLFSNNAYSSLAANASNSTTTLTLATGTGARFPSPTGGNYFLLTLVGLDSNANESSWEIVKVTARSTDTLTVVRAQESTTAVSWGAGTRVESRATAGTFSELIGALASYAPLASPTFTGSIKGDFSNATASSRVAFQSSTANSSTIIAAKPSGTGTSSYLQSFNASDADNSGYVYLGITGTVATINSAKTGTGTALPLIFAVDSAERMRISVAGNVGIGKSAPDQLLQVYGGNIDLQEEVAGRRIGFYVSDSYTAGTVGDAVTTARYGLTFGSYVGSSVNLGGWGGLTFSTADAERLRISNAGAIGIGGANYGTAGQVLTSGGPSAAPTWSTVSGGGGFTQNSPSANYTLILSDSGKQIFHPSTDTTARTFTIPANSSVAYPIGTELTVINQYGAGTVTLTSTDTLRLASTGSTGNALVATGNMAQLIKVTSTEWLVNGATKDDVPTTIGQAYGGGFYAGKINVSGTQYYLIVSPKATGEASGKTWGTYGNTTGITSVINGPTNSASLAALSADYQAANFCEGLTIGGFSDWYLPSKNELEVLYYFLKPTTDANNTSSGSNANAVSPEPISTNYTSGSPAQTSAGIGFRTGETDAFASDYYWSSTEYSSTFAWLQGFGDGYQSGLNKVNGLYVRAVRRIAV